jgi:hypothetical protein
MQDFGIRGKTGVYAMMKNKSSNFKWAVALTFTPMLVSVVFGVYGAIVTLYAKAQLGNGNISFVDSVIFLFVLPAFVGVIGWLFYLPPALIIAVIAGNLHERKSIKSLLILLMSTGFLVAGWLFFCDFINFVNHMYRMAEYTERSRYWSQFFWVVRGWSYAGPAFVAATAILVMELVARYFMRKEKFLKRASD